VLIVYRLNSTIAKDAASFCQELFQKKNIQSFVLASDFTKKTIKSILTQNSSKPNLVIILGGDGTVLKSANELANYNIPMLSFNIGGNLGFLTQDKSILFDETFFSLLKNEKFKIDSRSILQCSYKNNNPEKNNLINETYFYALNDFYFKSMDNDISPTNQIRVKINNETVNEYKGDGLIISSSTGSTAYSMAAGGPIVHPSINAFIINPICPMSLSSRPIIVPDKSKIIIETPYQNQQGLQMWNDGTKCQTIYHKDFCEITKGPYPANMISFCNESTYYKNLVKKLEWRGNIS